MRLYSLGMSSPLEQTIDALSDPDVPLPAALRRLYVVARRIGSADLAATITAELDGYPLSSAVPEYRQLAGLRVTVRFDGFGGSADHLHVAADELPTHLAGALSGIELRQPVAELEALTSPEGENDPRLELPLAWTAAYRELAAQRKAPGFEMMVANAAYISMPRTHLRGLLDRLRGAALKLALDLEQVSTQAGTPDGPTIDDNPALETVSAQFVQITAAPGAVVNVGDGNSVAAGDGATSVALSAGDIGGLAREAAALLSTNGAQEFLAALAADGHQAGDSTRSFLARVKDGGYLLATGVGTNAAYDGLRELLKQVFPGFS